MDIRTFTEQFLQYETDGGREADAQAWFRARLEEFGFETYEWSADAERLAEHPSFPDDPAEIQVVDRPSVAGVLELGSPDAGPTFVLNGHADVVPADEENWSTPPFEPTWGDAADRDGDDLGDGNVDRGAGGERDGGDGPADDGETLTARGAVDMKSPLAACVYAALDAAETAESAGLDGRIVVESVAGEEEGGIGAAAAALDNPYPFERDAALVAEPTDMRCITAVEGTVMKRLHVRGRSAHAATRWVGEDVLDHFERIRAAFRDLETERARACDHPLYEEYPIPAPVVVGKVSAGNWASSVPSSLTAECRLGVLPGESVDEVEAMFEARLQEVVDESEWLSANPPDFERLSIQFEPAETDPDEPVVGALRAAMAETGLRDTEPHAATYGADSRHYVEAGIPTVLFGPGTIEQAHFPDETVRWRDVERARETIAETVLAYLDER